MALLNKLTTQGSPYSKDNGASPSQYSNNPGSQSKLHREYSINGTPKVRTSPLPSDLSLDGKTPAKYLDNLPK